MTRTAPRDAHTWLTEILPALLRDRTGLPRDLVFSLQLREHSDWTIDLTTAGGAVEPRLRADARCVLSMSADDLLAIVGDPESALDLYDQGRIGLTGSVDSALEVVTLFHRLREDGVPWAPPSDPRDFVYNPLTPSFDEDPYPIYAYMRRHAPVYYWKDLKYWLVSRLEDVKVVLTDPRLTKDHTTRRAGDSSRAPNDDIIADLLENSPLNLSDDRQARWRSLINPVFSANSVRRLRGDVERMTQEMLDELEQRPVVDLIDGFTEPFPRRMMAKMLGVPEAHRAAFDRFSEALMDGLLTRAQQMDSTVARRDVAAGIEALRDLIELRRRDPGSDLLSELISAERRGEQFSYRDLVSLVATLVTTGVDSTVFAMNQAFACLLRFPEQAELIRQDATLLPKLIDEVLRYDNFHKLGVPRWATEDLELGGQLIRKGEGVAAMFQSAGRDEAAFADADVFDVRRDLKRAFTFGLGRHNCPGAAISRLEFEVVFGEVIRRYPRMKLVAAPTFRPQIFVRAYKTMPVALQGDRRPVRKSRTSEPRPTIARRPLGSTGLTVSALGLGTVTFGAAETFMKGRTASDADARRILDVALDAGVDLIDTANVFSEGRAESLLGEWLGARRARVVLATKCRFALGFGLTGPVGPDDQGLSRAAIIKACEASLRRLSTDYIDLYQVQAQDTSVPIEETLRALEELVRAGKVRHVGCSTYSGHRLVESLWVSERARTARYATHHVQWSLANRGVEREVIPACRAHGLGIIVASPLAQGFLAGAYRRDQPPFQGDDLRARQTIYRSFDSPRGWRILEVLERIALRHETAAASVATAWAAAQPGVSSVLVTARSVEQLEDGLASASLTLSTEDLRELDEASRLEFDYPYSHLGPTSSW